MLIVPTTAILGPGPLTLTWITHATIEADQTAYNYGNFTMPRSGFLVAIFLAHGVSSRTVSSVSIGGTNGTIHSSNVSGTGKYALASREVSAGAHNVTVTLSGSNGGDGPSTGCGVWILENTSLAADAVDTGTNTVVFNMLARSISVYGGLNSVGGAVSWSSATERADIGLSSNARRVAWADKSTVAAITPHTETLTTTSSAVGGTWS